MPSGSIKPPSSSVLNKKIEISEYQVVRLSVVLLDDDSDRLAERADEPCCVMLRTECSEFRRVTPQKKFLSSHLIPVIDFMAAADCGGGSVLRNLLGHLGRNHRVTSRR